MSSSRKNSFITGGLFIIGTVAALVAAMVEPILNDKSYLTKLSANATQISIGALFYLIAAFASVGIAISLYSVLKRWNGGFAMGFVIFRTIEAVLYIVAVLGLLALLSVSQHFTNANSSDSASFKALGDMLLSLREQATLTGVFAFSLGSGIYYCLFFISRLIPRWLAGWGLLASVLMFIACLLALFSGNYITSYVPLILPIAVQEMVLAVWILVKGFNIAHITNSANVTEVTNEASLKVQPAS